MNTVKTAVIATLMTGLAAPVLADNHGRYGAGQEAAQATAREEQKLRHHHEEEAGNQSRRAKAAGEQEQKELEERREEADEKAAKARKQAKDATHNDDDQGRPDVPPGLGKKAEHPSTGHGSEQGQESRAKQEKKWWQFWQ